MAMIHRITTDARDPGSLLIAAMILLMTGLPGLEICGCPRLPSGCEMPSINVTDTNTSCCCEREPNQGCSFSGDRNEKPLKDDFTMAPRKGGRHSFAMQPASDNMLRLETRPHPLYSPPACEICGVLHQISTTVLLI